MCAKVCLTHEAAVLCFRLVFELMTCSLSENDGAYVWKGSAAKQNGTELQERPRFLDVRAFSSTSTLHIPFTVRKSLPCLGANWIRFCRAILAVGEDTPQIPKIWQKVHRHSLALVARQAVIKNILNYDQKPPFVKEA